jgi:hypothetical protein
VGAGLGICKSISFFELDVDVGVDAYGLFKDELQDQPEILAPRARMTLGWPIFKWLSPFVGMTASYGIRLEQSTGTGVVQASEGSAAMEGGRVSWEGGVRF